MLDDNRLDSMNEQMTKTCEMATDHTERLMFQLKILGVNRMRDLEVLRVLKSSEAKYKRMISKQNKIILASKKYISKMKTNYNCMEEQMILMEEKYNQLRSSLDYVRR